MSEYFVTIGIPVYRSVDYVRNTMLSALAQNFPYIEFLIVDDCGDDGSIRLIEDLKQNHPKGKHIRILKNSGNFGVGYCRNRIIAEAKGKYLYFLDSDDVIEPITIRLLYDAAVQYQAETVYASYDIFDCSRLHHREIFRKDNKHFIGEGLLAEYAFDNVSIFHVSVCNCLMDVSFLRRTGVKFINAKYWEDMAFTYDLLPKVTCAVLLPDITYHYYRHPNSLSHYQHREQLPLEEVMMNVSVINYLKDKCRSYLGTTFIPSICYNLELNSFYIICHVIKNNRQISHPVSFQEMRRILRYPLELSKVLRFRSKLFPNLFFFLLGRLPVPLFILLVWMLGKIKKAI